MSKKEIENGMWCCADFACDECPYNIYEDKEEKRIFCAASIN